MAYERINPDVALKKLDTFRQKMAIGEINPGSPDWIVRMCQSYIAGLAGYSDRATWVEKIKDLQEKGEL